MKVDNNPNLNEKTLDEKYQEELKKSQDIDLGKKLEDEFEKIKQTITKPNILIAGCTGAGKSTLINMIFGNKVAVVGTGKPVTQKIDIYESNDTDVRIFDSKGYELGSVSDDEFFNSVIKLAEETQNPENAIHLVWYCIPYSNTKVTDYDLAAIEAFHKAKLPVAVVLTNADTGNDKVDSAMRDVLPEWVKKSVFQTSDRAENLNHINELVAWSIEMLPEALRIPFIKTQKNNVKEKWKKAHIMIGEHAAIAFGTGFVPIPVADAPILVTNEMALLARILYLYDLGSISPLIKTMGISTILGPLLTTGGKALASSLLKLIPGVGTLVGGAISGAVGAGVTLAFGEASSTTACCLCKAMLSGDNTLVEYIKNNFGNVLVDILKGGSAKKSSDDYSFEETEQIFKQKLGSRYKG